MLPHIELFTSAKCKAACSMVAVYSNCVCYSVPTFCVVAQVHQKLCCCAACCIIRCQAVYCCMHVPVVCTMLCYAVLCSAMQCYAMLCHAMPCHAMPCYAMLCYAALCSDLSSGRLLSCSSWCCRLLSICVSLPLIKLPQTAGSIAIHSKCRLPHCNFSCQ